MSNLPCVETCDGQHPPETLCSPEGLIQQVLLFNTVALVLFFPGLKVVCLAWPHGSSDLRKDVQWAAPACNSCGAMKAFFDRCCFSTAFSLSQHGFSFQGTGSSIMCVAHYRSRKREWMSSLNARAGHHVRIRVAEELPTSLLCCVLTLSKV